MSKFEITKPTIFNYKQSISRNIYPNVVSPLVVSHDELGHVSGSLKSSSRIASAWTHPSTNDQMRFILIECGLLGLMKMWVLRNAALHTNQTRSPVVSKAT
jgi:hypothetical protein